MRRLSADTPLHVHYEPADCHQNDNVNHIVFIQTTHS